MTVRTTHPTRAFALTLKPALAVAEAPADPAAPVLELMAAKLIRLVSGRLDPAHLLSTGAEGRNLERARRAFTGF